MTTKLTEAEMKALPVCKCGKPAMINEVHSWVTCVNKECLISSMAWVSVDQWRLLMTPEAKGEEIDYLKAWIGNLEDLNVTKGKLCATLRSKLAESEERVKELEELVQSGTNQYKFMCKARDANFTEISSLKQQLAEATKPVGDELLAAHAERLRQNYTSIGKDQAFADSWNYVLRAARQRKPSGDAVRLAWMVKDRFGSMSNADFAKKWNVTIGSIGAAMMRVADSIIAQSVAGETKPFIEQNYKNTGIQEISLISRPDDAARVPAADLLTADERAEIESLRSGPLRKDSRAALFVGMADRFAPKPEMA